MVRTLISMIPFLHQDGSRGVALIFWKTTHLLLMAEILHQLRLVVYPIIYRGLYISGGAGFLPSTVVSQGKLQNSAGGPKRGPIIWCSKTPSDMCTYVQLIIIDGGIWGQNTTCTCLLLIVQKSGEKATWDVMYRTRRR